MSHLPTLITDLALILISAGVITLIFKWLKQPLVLGYIVAGLLAGPYINIFPTVVDIESVNIWAEIGVVFLLFALGLEFSFKKLVNVGSSAFITAITEVITMLIVGFLVGRLLSWSVMDSIFLGGMLSMSSTTIIIKAFDDLGLRKQHFTTIVFGTLVVEDLIAILMMVLLSTMAVSQEFVGEELFMSILKVGFFLILWFLIGIFLIPAFLKKTRKLMNNETLLIIALGLCLGMVVLATKTGFSAALGAFIMGSILAETVEAEHIEHIIQPVKDLFGAIFFVSVGMLVNPAVLIDYSWPIIIITLVTIFGKATFSTFGVLLSGQPLKTSIKSGFSLAQIGEFAFIIAALGVSLKVLDDYVYPIIVAVSVITTFTTPYFIRLAEPFSEWLYKVLPPRAKDFLASYTSGKKTVNHDSDWKKLFKAHLGKGVIYTVLLTAILLLSIHVVYPMIQNRVDSISFWGRVGVSVGTLLLMAPFLWALISNKYNSPNLFMSLWRDSKYNRGRLVALVLSRITIAIVFVSAVLIYYLQLNYGVGIIIAVAVLIFILLFRSNLNQYSKIESHFLTNLNERETAMRKRSPLKSSFHDEFSEKDIHLLPIEVSPYSELVGKPLSTLALREKFGINIVKIIRGDVKIQIPSGDECFYPQDQVVAVGTDDQLARFREQMEVAPVGQQKTESSKEVDLHSFTVDDSFPFLGKTVIASQIGEKFNSLVVAIERNDELISLSKDTTFELNDLVWVVGEREKVRTMLQLA